MSKVECEKLKMPCLVERLKFCLMLFSVCLDIFVQNLVLNISVTSWDLGPGSYLDCQDHDLVEYLREIEN